MAIMLIVFWITTPTGVAIMLAKLFQKKNMIRKIYPGSRREKLYLGKKASADDIFSIDPKTKKIDVIDGAMKTEFGSTMCDGIRIHTCLADNMAPMGPDKAAAATAMIKDALEKDAYPLLSQIRELNKISDLMACDMVELPKKAKKYVVVSSTNKTKEQLKKDKEDAVPNLMNEVVSLRGKIASRPYPVDYISAINAVLNPVTKGVIEHVGMLMQKRAEDAQKRKEQMQTFALAGAIVIGAIFVGIAGLYMVIGKGG
jgi:hypothetical protein